MSYNDAVKLLGGDKDRIVQLLDTLMGVGMLAALGPFRDVLEWFDAKAELSKVTERLVSGLVERRSEMSRWERTERLQAAHAVLVVSAYFEALAESGLPFEYRTFEFTAEEQRSLGDLGEPRSGAIGAPVPGPAEAHDDFRERLIEHYRGMSVTVGAFAQGLAVWDRLGAGARDTMLKVLNGLPGAAVARHESLLGRLAGEFPEVAFWAGMREQGATHARLREVTTALDGLRGLMDSLAAGRGPDERREALARAYAGALQRPIAPAGDVPLGLKVPTLAEAFLPQLYRACLVTGHTPLSSEGWWEPEDIRDDLLAFLTGHLTSAAAVTAPLLILGHPGSGKSVLSKLLAAQLPASAFMPVLVPLRTVSASAGLQDQIEQAVREDTGERVEWPDLSRSSGDALPLVILDGFDELLQATGVSQTDYLQKVTTFQRREADQGRPVAVIVTSRTSVADRANPSEDTVVLRLEPFDDERIGAWLATWNRINAARFTSGPEKPLEIDTVLRYRDLAGQPLLLLMLALYDAEDNALKSAGELMPYELYERLLERFARREVDKTGKGLSARAHDLRVESELYRLSVVAFAMFNRGTQWVTEADLEKDLQLLPVPADPVPASPAADLRAPLSAAERALGSFFFVHRAQAMRDGARLETFEFLHATFGEFLVARLAYQVVKSMIGRQRATNFLSGSVVDDDVLHALLSWAPLADRRQIVSFLRGIVAAMPDSERAEWTDLLIGLFRAAPRSRPPRGHDGYQPRALTVPSRIAAYTANLLILALCGEDLTAGRLFGRGARTADAVIRDWQDTSWLWHSQASASGWQGLIGLVAVTKVFEVSERDVALSLDGDPRAIPPMDLAWLLDMRGLPFGEIMVHGNVIRDAAQEANFTCDVIHGLQQHALEPLRANDLAILGGVVVADSGHSLTSLLAEILATIALPEGSVRDRLGRYTWASRFPGRHVDLLLHRLATDQALSVTNVLPLLRALQERHPEEPQTDRTALARCAMAHLGPETSDLAEYLFDLLRDRSGWSEVELEAAIRLAELDWDHPLLRHEDAMALMQEHGIRRPDFKERIKAIVDPNR